MSRILRSVLFLFTLLLVLVGLVVSVAAQDTKVVRTASVHPTTAIDGRTLYREYCAGCHGLDGRGLGPAARTLNQLPSDLTIIARRNNGRFPDDKMFRVLRGTESVAPHGTQEMPVWGPVFYDMSNSLSMGQLRIHSLVSYLEQIQAK